MGYLSRMLGRVADRFGPKKPICCLSCHYAYEERVCGPHLPAWARKWLTDQHDLLHAKGNPPELVKKHAEQEMVLFQRYCPPDVVAQVEADHDHLSAEL